MSDKRLKSQSRKQRKAATKHRDQGHSSDSRSPQSTGSLEAGWLNKEPSFFPRVLVLVFSHLQINYWPLPGPGSINPAGQVS